MPASGTTPVTELCATHKLRNLFVQPSEHEIFENLMQKTVSDADPKQFNQTLKTLLENFSKNYDHLLTPEEFARWFHKKNGLSVDDILKLTPESAQTYQQSRLFLKDEFLMWFQREKNGFSAAEIEGFRKSGTTYEQAINKAYQKFEDLNPTAKLMSIPGKSHEFMEKLVKLCGKNRACIEEKTKGIFARMFKCMAKNSNALESLFTSYTLMFAGYVFYAGFTDNGTDQPKNKDSFVEKFHYDLFLNNLFWSPILTEIGCKNLERDKVSAKIQRDEWNTKISTLNNPKFKDPLLEKFLIKDKMTANKYIKKYSTEFGRYMLYSPAYWVSYFPLHWAQEKAFDRDTSINWTSIGKDMVAMTIIDAAFVTPRMIFITDPLYLKGVPAIRSWFTDMTKSPTTSRVGVKLLEVGGMRIPERVASTKIFDWWMGFSKKHLWDNEALKPEPKNVDRTPGKSKTESQSGTSP